LTPTDSVAQNQENLLTIAQWFLGKKKKRKKQTNKETNTNKQA
jgi:hypothetical protein